MGTEVETDARKGSSSFDTTTQAHTHTHTHTHLAQFEPHVSLLNLQESKTKRGVPHNKNFSNPTVSADESLVNGYGCLCCSAKLPNTTVKATDDHRIPSID